MLSLFVRSPCYLQSFFVTFFIIFTNRLSQVRCFSTLLVKTKETFKLSELQYLEAKLQAQTFTCQRLLVDLSTGSTLIFINNFLPQNSWPTSLKRADWVGEILVESNHIQTFVTKVRSMTVIPIDWTLNYIHMQNYTKSKGLVRNFRKEYNSQSLLTCVAQAIESKAQLNPNHAIDKLLVVDIETNYYLIRILPKQTEDREFQIVWNNRPFQYSSSINPNSAEIIVNILMHFMDDEKSQRLLLDPTCGSGTFLAMAICQGIQAEGWDHHQACVEGAEKNLVHFFGHEKRWSLHRKDATQYASKETLKKVSCIVANLPWGQNTIAYHNENNRILETLTSSLTRRIPCAFITKNDQLQNHMNKLGYEIMGVAHIPPKGIQFPSLKKNVGGAKIDSSHLSTSSCVIVIAFSP
jgi:tRNA G10  N-methylase Trm11